MGGATGRNPPDWEHIDAVIADRSAAHAANHWREFSVIIASGTIAATLVAAGAVVNSHQPFQSKAMLCVLLCISIIGFALAYYSIQVGVIPLVGFATARDIVSSFAVAASQLSLPLWVLHIARTGHAMNLRQLTVMDRHWFFFAAMFGLSGAFTAGTAAMRMRSFGSNPPAWAAAYLKRQLSDRTMSAMSGLLLLGIWIISLLVRSGSVAGVWVTAGGASVTGIAWAGGFMSQHRTAIFLQNR